MFKEFKEFAVKGNVIDLAVGVIIGAAFTSIVNSIVNDIITPILGIFLGNINFSGLVVEVGNSTITYGKFLNAVFQFLIVAFVMFLFVKQINRLRKAPPKDPTEKDCPFCFRRIPIKATRCPECTSSFK